MDSRLTQPVEEFGKSAGEYIDLRIEELKLKTAKGLSVTLHRILLAVLFLSLGGIVLTTAAFGILLIGQLMHNYALGAFLVSAFFLVLLIVLVLLRKKLFINGLVKMFIGLFFEEKDEEEED